MPTGRATLMPALRRVVLAGTNADRTDGQLLSAFVADRDADAFGLLVRRHGPMVLGVCRRVIGELTTAEDAFQAVFLVLARRAAAVKPREQVGNWLYGVAYRTALKARAVLARRRSREKQVEVMPEPPVPPSPDEWADLQPVIDEELARLPEKLRAPVVLCDLEGRPQREVAKQLGVPPATLATRLASARRTLATRLTRRGVTLSGGAVAGLLTAHGTASAVPPALAHGLARAAEAVATGSACSGLVSPSAVQLSEGVIRMMMLSKLKAVAVMAFTAVAITGGLGIGLIPAYANGSGNDPAPAQHEAVAARPLAPAPAPPAPAQHEAVAAKWLELTATLSDDVDDVTFLRRLSLDVRGLPPTDVETVFFVSDEDDAKRAKVVTWMIDEDGTIEAAAAEQLGVPKKQVRVVRNVDVGDGQQRVIVVVVADDNDPQPKVQKIQTRAFTPDGKEVKLEGAIDKTIERRWAMLRAGQPVPGGKDTFWLDAQIQPGAKDVLLLERFFDAQTTPPAGAGQRVVIVKASSDDPKKPQVRVWDAATGKLIVTGDGQHEVVWGHLDAGPHEGDAEFLKRVIKEARGTAPTALEEKYFTEDKDPKKREKLLDALLKDPAVAKKLGDTWKKKMLAAPMPTVTKEKTFQYKVVPFDPKGGKFQVVPFDPKGGEFKFDFDFVKPIDPKLFDPKKGGTFEFKLFDPKKDGNFEFKLFDPSQPQKFEFKLPPDFKPGVPFKLELPFKDVPFNPAVPPKPPVPPQPPVPPAPQAPQADKLGKLVDELLAAKKTDAEMLEAVTLAVASRLPTDTEKRLTLGLVSKAGDRKAAWVEVAKALAGGEAGGPARRVEVKIVPVKP